VIPRLVGTCPEPSDRGCHIDAHMQEKYRYSKGARKGR